MKIVVVGAGISGCVSAFRLAEAGHDVTLLEKGRGVGGRMSTRRMGGARIDHGAQFFTVRDKRMKDLLAQWEAAGAVVPWYDSIPGREDVPRGIRYRGVRGMTGPAKVLAGSFSFMSGFFVDSVFFDEEWQINEKEGAKRKLFADHLVLTLPVPQMLELFKRSNFELESAVMDRLEAVRYTRCLALLGILDQPSVLTAPGTVTHPHPEIDWVSDNQVKGISEIPACTVHAGDAYSQKFWEAPDEERGPFLVSVAEECLQSKISEWTCHRWGFAKPLVTFGATQYTSAWDRLSLAGDSFGGERIENAAMSGWDAAQAIIDQT
jgi:predicted NAD/FAD-dependent oxidoreductase